MTNHEEPTNTRLHLTHYYNIKSPHYHAYYYYYYYYY